MTTTTTAEAPAARPAAREDRVSVPLLVTLALLSAIAPFATDLYLPAFPAMVSDLATTTTGVQLSLTTFLIGAGVGQVLFGPLSDRIGRRVPLVVGTLLFVAASIGAALAPTVWILVVLRLAQGLFGAAGMVIGRSIISDRSEGAAAARAFSLMMLVGGIAPIIAPFLGSILADSLGWRGLLWIVAGIGVVAALAVLFIVAETRPREVIRAEVPKARESVLRKLASREFITNSFAYAFGFAAMMAYISASPFLYQDMMGLSTIGFGIAFAINAIALAVVSMISIRLTRHYSVRRLAGLGLGLHLLAVVAVVVLVVADVATIWLALPIVIAVGALGLVLGNTTALALASVPRAVSGSASAVLGFLQFVLAGLVSPLVSLGGEDTALPFSIVMAVSAAIAFGSFAAGASRRAESTSVSATID